MELNLFVYVLLIFCIPYLLYSNIRIKPRKGFSILFISIISSVILLNFSILTILGTFLYRRCLCSNKSKISSSAKRVKFLLLQALLKPNGSRFWWVSINPKIEVSKYLEFQKVDLDYHRIFQFQGLSPNFDDVDGKNNTFLHL